jgi:hypothetical protein
MWNLNMKNLNKNASCELLDVKFGHETIVWKILSMENLGMEAWMWKSLDVKFGYEIFDMEKS